MNAYVWCGLHVKLCDPYLSALPSPFTFSTFSALECYDDALYKFTTYLLDLKFLLVFISSSKSWEFSKHYIMATCSEILTSGKL